MEVVGFRVSVCGMQVQGLQFEVQGPVFRVESFGFRIPGLWYLDRDAVEVVSREEQLLQVAQRPHLISGSRV